MNPPESAAAPTRKRAWLDAVLAVPVFVKVMGIALGMALMLGGGMLWQIHQTWHGHLLRELEQRGQQLANETAIHCAELLRTGQTEEISAILRRILDNSPEAAYLVLQNTNGAILAEVRQSTLTAAGPQVRELYSPVGAGPHRLVAGISTAKVDEEVSWLTRRLARLTATITLLGLLAAWGLTHIFAHPILELVSLTRAVKAGNYQAKASVRASDEVGELAAAFNEMTAAIAEKEAARQQLLGQVIRAGEEERKRIARELHDHTGQALTSQIAALNALESHCPDEKCLHRLTELRQQTEQMLAEVHDLSLALRPAVLDDVGLMAALERHCRMFSRRMGVVVVCQDDGLDGERLPPEVELTIYRLVQETLTNAVRHGRATRMTALIERQPAGVRAIVQDNGSGFDPQDWRKHCATGNHLGLMGIEERVMLLGGVLEIESTHSCGTRVIADIPIKPEAAA
jgi:signal transduction histidine kinase